MKIYFGYKKGQVLQALRYHFIAPRLMFIMLIAVNVFAFASLVLYFMKKISPMACFIGTFLWIVLMISLLFILPNMAYRRGKITFQNDFSMDFTDDGFTLGHENRSNKWPWSALRSFLESPHFFHLYFDNRAFILVPKDGCRDKEEVAELRQLLKEKVKKR